MSRGQNFPKNVKSPWTLNRNCRVTQFNSIPYSKQDIDTGCYKKEGFVIHSELAKDSNVALTASLLITMLEDENADLQG